MLFYKLKNSLGKSVPTYFWSHYRRFLDNGQIMWDSRLGDLKEVLSFRDSLDPCIKFTSECSNERLIYLDIVMVKSATGFITEIHQKETSGGRYRGSYAHPYGPSFPWFFMTSISLSPYGQKQGRLCIFGTRFLSHIFSQPNV